MRIEAQNHTISESVPPKRDEDPWTEFRAHIRMPTGTGMHPWRAARRRPKIVAFLLRLFT